MGLSGKQRAEERALFSNLFGDSKHSAELGVKNNDGEKD